MPVRLRQLVRRYEERPLLLDSSTQRHAFLPRIRCGTETVQKGTRVQDFFSGQLRRDYNQL